MGRKAETILSILGTEQKKLVPTHTGPKQLLSLPLTLMWFPADAEADYHCWAEFFYF
jgi:hypothetical protein